MLKELAEYTPAAALSVFEHGELRLGTVVVMLIVARCGVALAEIWLPYGVAMRQRMIRTVERSRLPRCSVWPRRLCEAVGM